MLQAVVRHLRLWHKCFVGKYLDVGAPFDSVNTLCFFSTGSALIHPKTRARKPQGSKTERELTLASANGCNECFLFMTKIKIQKNKQNEKYPYVVSTAAISSASPRPLCKKNSRDKIPGIELAKFQCRIASFTQVANTQLQEEELTTRRDWLKWVTPTFWDRTEPSMWLDEADVCHSGHDHWFDLLLYMTGYWHWPGFQSLIQSFISLQYIFHFKLKRWLS